MKRNIILLILLMCTGCANSAKSNVELLTAFNEQMYLFPDHVIDFPIVFGNQEDMTAQNRAGTCAVGIKSRKPKYIEVNKESWDKASPLYKKALILHELGHCLLDLQHTKGETDLMNSSISGSILCVHNKGVRKCVEDAKKFK